MYIKTAALFLVLTSSAPLIAGGVPDEVFESSFEFGEACTRFDGFNDSVNLLSVSVSGDLTLNGGAFSGTDFDDGVFSFRDRITGDVFEIGDSHDQEYEINVVAGRYDVLFSLQSPGATIPRNVGAVVMEDVVLFSDTDFDINLTTFTIGGDFLLNGGPFPDSDFDDANLFLDSELLGRVAVGNTNEQSFENLVVIAGQYEIRYQVETRGNQSPWNEWGFAGSLNVTENDNSVEINIDSVTLSGAFSHNGADMPDSELDDGLFYLEKDDGDRVLLGNSHDGSYARNVIPNKYSVYWELDTLGATVPVNERAQLIANMTTDVGTLDIDMTSFPVSGAFTLNDGAFPDSFLNTGQIVFRDTVAAVDNVVGMTSDAEYDQQVIAGSYDVVYQHVLGGDVPQNKNALLSGDIHIDGAAELNINVPARLYSAGVYHNGELFPASAQQVADIFLRNPDTGDQLLLGRTPFQFLSQLVIDGTYDAYYSYFAGDQIPANQMALFQQGVMVESVGPLDQNQGGGGGNELHVTSMVVAGSMSINGGPFPENQFDDGLMLLKWEEDSLPLGETHDPSFEARVVMRPDNPWYWVHFSLQSPGVVVPFNGDARVMCVRVEPIDV